MALQVQIKRSIYIRKGAGKSFDHIGVAEPSGNLLTMDGKETGESWKGINDWYYKINDKKEKQYYWGGGLTEAIESNIDTGINYGWSISSLGVDKVWNVTRGENVKVAIIDSGIDLNNSDLISSISSTYNILDNTNNVQDTFGHGTCCATVLSSRGNSGLFGVAPRCNTIIIKIQNEKEIKEENMIAGIKKASEFDADIISISFGGSNRNPEIISLLNQYMTKGIICIAAAGDKSNDVVFFPANVKGMIAVGNIKCLNPNAPFGQSIYDISDKSPGLTKGDDELEEITIVAPGDGIQGYDFNSKKLISISGTSFSAPYVAGIAALWLSKNMAKKISPKNAHREFKNFIINNALTLKDQKKYEPQKWGNGVINPLSILRT